MTNPGGIREPDVVSICVPGFPGPNRMLATVAEVTGACRHIVLADSRRGGPETRFIRDYIDDTRPRAVILGGWSSQYEPLLARLHRESPRWVVLWASSAGQMSLAGEVPPYLRLVADRRIDRLLYVDPRLARGPLATLKPSAYFPVLAPPVELEARPARRQTVISLFLAAQETPRKNLFTTLLALAALDRTYILYLNGLSSLPHVHRLLREFKIPYRDFGWMERPQYQRVLLQVDVGIQVSFAESFNQVAADHGVRGIPVVVSEMVPAFAKLPPAIRQRLVVTNPDDPDEIRSVLARLIKRPAERVRIGAAVRTQLATEYARNVRTVTRVLRRL